MLGCSPLSSVQHWVPLFQKWLGVSLPGVSQVRFAVVVIFCQVIADYVPRLADAMRSQVANAVRGSHLSLIIDESPDSRPTGNVVHVVACIPGKKSLLLSQFCLSAAANNVDIVTAWNTTIHQFAINGNHVLSFHSDRASYISLGLRSIMPSHPRMLDMPCLAHWLHNVANDVLQEKEVEDAVAFMKNLNKLFKHSVNRRKKWKEFSKKKVPPRCFWPFLFFQVQHDTMDCIS